MIGYLSITAVCAPITSFCSLWPLILYDRQRSARDRQDADRDLAYLCRFCLLSEADRRDRPVRGLSSLFTKAHPELAVEAWGLGELP